MNNLLAITPDQFSTAAMAWLGALVIVITGLSLALVKIAPVIAQITELFRRSDHNATRLDSQQRQITNVALHTPPPAQAAGGPPQRVEVVNEPSSPVPTTETK